jgi:plastocyanin
MAKKIIGATLALACAALMFLASCKTDTTSPYGGTSNAAPSQPAAPNSVVMASMAFGPTSVTVSAGTTITWQNNDGVAHTSTSDTGVWDTGSIPPGGSKTTTFNTAGSFPYHCTVHPMMTGTIIVK